MKVLLADDHRMLRDGLRAILERAQITVVGDAATGREALTQARALRPDIVLMDIAMPDLNGIDATQRLVAELPEVKVIALSMNSDHRYVLAMLHAGAQGYLLKSSAADELIQAISQVQAGNRYVSSSLVDLVRAHSLERSGESLRHPTPPLIAAVRALSPREREVLQLLAEGNSSKEIAARLNLAVPTVETHRRQITDKLGLRTIAELTKYAIRQGLTSLE